ncbi:PLDc N-terminal domain-containing protein [Pseudomonas sp. NY15435]|uniref:PLDc N-terminal domain-containing protein n=1 Tax=Pseudomonas sp. NY15435 TaxID=3400358 RepID=UPI003A87A679
MSSLLSVFWIAVATIIVLLDLWAILSIFRSDKGVNAKALWSLLIAILPVLGLVIWGIAGPRGVAQEPPLD